MGEGEGVGMLRFARSGVGDLGEGEDAGEVGTGGFETRQEGVVEVVVWSDEEDIGLGTGSAIGPGLACGEMGGKGESEEGGAAVGRAVEEGEFVSREATGPEPGKGSDD